MAKRANDDVRFEAVYEDGRTFYFSIDSGTLRSGDHVARIIARERQASGELPAGHIANVRRDR